MVFQRGDVVLVPFPYSNLSTTKVRPAIVVSSQSYHALEPDIILAAIISRIMTASAPFDHILRDWRGAGLRFPSALKPVLFTLAPSRVIHRIGTLSSADLAAIDHRLRQALDL